MTQHHMMISHNFCLEKIMTFHHMILWWLSIILWLSIIWWLCIIKNDLLAPQRACRPVRVQTGGCAEVICNFYNVNKLWVSIIRCKYHIALSGSCNGGIRLGIFHFKDHFKQKCHFHFLINWVLLKPPL